MILGKHKKLLEELKSQIRIQSEPGIWDYDKYNLGFYNGLESALAIIENRKPILRQRPKTFIVVQDAEKLHNLKPRINNGNDNVK